MTDRSCSAAHGSSRRGVLRSLTLVAVAAAALGLAPTAAFAKSDITLTVGPHTVRPGAVVQVRGFGDDDSAGYNRFCVQQRSDSGGWRTVKCARGSFHGGGSLSFGVRATKRGVLRFRGVLLEGSSPQDRHPLVRSYSRTISVTAR